MTPTTSMRREPLYGIAGRIVAALTERAARNPMKSVPKPKLAKQAPPLDPPRERRGAAARDRGRDRPAVEAVKAVARARRRRAPRPFRPLLFGVDRPREARGADDQAGERDGSHDVLIDRCVFAGAQDHLHVAGGSRAQHAAIELVDSTTINRLEPHADARDASIASRARGEDHTRAAAQEPAEVDGRSSRDSRNDR
ncbi:MAG: hypothetical protein ACR2KV_00890 [Solirubrobacteraceae bacterium]